MVIRQKDGVNLWAPIQDRIPEALIRFITVMHKIIKDYYLSTVPQKNIITHNIVLVESLRVFEHKTRELGMKNNNNYELFIQDMISR